MNKKKIKEKASAVHTIGNEADAAREPKLSFKEMSLLEHLLELRRRLMAYAVVLLLGFFVSYYFSKEIYNFLAQPLFDAWRDLGVDVEGKKMIATALTEQFFTEVKLAFAAAIFITSPFLLSQVWLFVAPGLYKNERRAFLPFLVATPVFFMLGAGFVYYVVIPAAWKFFLQFEQLGGEITIELQPKVNEYLSLMMQLILAFGFCFELPVLLVLLVRVGLLQRKQLQNKRRYAIVAAFIIAAILTPPDPLSQVALALPLILLYELAIGAAYFVERGRVAKS